MPAYLPQIHAPNTMPPFQNTNPPKRASTGMYGTNGGSNCGTAFGRLMIDFMKSATNRSAPYQCQIGAPATYPDQLSTQAGHTVTRLRVYNGNASAGSHKRHIIPRRCSFDGRNNWSNQANGACFMQGCWFIDVGVVTYHSSYTVLVLHRKHNGSKY